MTEHHVEHRASERTFYERNHRRQPPSMRTDSDQAGDGPGLVLAGELVFAAWHIELQIHELAHLLSVNVDGEKATDALARIEHQLRDGALPDWMPGPEAIVRCLDDAAGCLAEREVLIGTLSTVAIAHKHPRHPDLPQRADAAAFAVVRDRCQASADRIQHMVTSVTPPRKAAPTRAVAGESHADGPVITDRSDLLAGSAPQET